MGGNLPPTRRAALESCHSTVKRGPVTQTGAESDQATAFQLVLKTAKTAQPCAIWAGERRGWDSNPRMTLTAIAGFQDLISAQRTRAGVMPGGITECRIKRPARHVLLRLLP
jgi:hypothetical protein